MEEWSQADHLFHHRSTVTLSLPNFPGSFGLQTEHLETIENLRSRREAMLHETGFSRIVDEVEEIMLRGESVVGQWWALVYVRESSQGRRVNDEGMFGYQRGR